MIDSQPKPDDQPAQDSHSRRTGYRATETTSGAIQKEPSRQLRPGNPRQDHQTNTNARDVHFSNPPSNRMDGVGGTTRTNNTDPPT